MKRVILGIIVIALIATGGFFGWKTWQNKHSSTTSPSTQQSTSDPSEGGKYLVIKEWGVRFKLPDDLKSTISYKDQSQFRENSIEFTSSQMESSDCAAIGLARTTSSDYKNDDPDGRNRGTFIKVNNYFYERISGVIACSNKEAVHQQAKLIQDRLYEALGSLEAIN